MKKTLLSFLMIGAVGLYTTRAQITIDDTDIVGMGDNVEVAHDTIPGAITIGSGGASQNWNFSTLNQDGLDTLRFRDPNTFPSSSNHPLANLGMTDTKEDSTWMFLNKNSAGLYVVGMHQIQNGQPIDFPLTSTIIEFPSTMGSNFNANWNGTLFVFPVGFDPDGPGPAPTIDSVKISRGTDINSNIDGWGNVTTPYGTFPSLRQIVTEENIDTTWYAINSTGTWAVIDPVTAALLSIDPIAYDTNRTARWWSDDPNTKFPVVEMNYEANGTVNNVDWQKSAPTVGVKEQVSAVANVSLYPNPAKDDITINAEITSGVIELLDLTGKIISTNRVNSNITNIDVSELSNSIYFYNIKDENGNTLYTSKFVVAK